MGSLIFVVVSALFIVFLAAGACLPFLLKSKALCDPQSNTPEDSEALALYDARVNRFHTLNGKLLPVHKSPGVWIYQSDDSESATQEEYRLSFGFDGSLRICAVNADGQA